MAKTRDGKVKLNIDLVRERMLALSLRPIDIAVAAGTNESSVYGWLGERNMPRVQHLAALATTLTRRDHPIYIESPGKPKQSLVLYER